MLDAFIVPLRLRSCLPLLLPLCSCNLNPQGEDPGFSDTTFDPSANASAADPNGESATNGMVPSLGDDEQDVGIVNPPGDEAMAPAGGGMGAPAATTPADSNTFAPGATDDVPAAGDPASGMTGAAGATGASGPDDATGQLEARPDAGTLGDGGTAAPLTLDAAADAGVPEATE